MTILHVLSQQELTGAEAYAVHLAQRQRQMGHSVLMVTDNLTYAYFGQVFRHPISKRSYPQRVRNIRTLIRLIRQHNVHVVHAHSRAASWVSNIACRVTRTAFVSTVHGLQHVHASSRTFNIYGRSIIAISERLARHLRDELRIPSSCITHIPNGFDISPRSAGRQPVHPGHGPVMLFAGRLSGPKGDVLRSLLRDVLPLIFPARNVIFRAVCGSDVPEDIKALISGLRSQWGTDRIIVDGFQKDLPAALGTADLVIGSGRIALESLLEEVPTIAFGESGFEGLVRRTAFEDAAITNFGDNGPRKAVMPSDVADAILGQLDSPIPASERRDLRDVVRQRYDIVNVEEAVAKVYREALVRVRPAHAVPVLMYHRIVKEPPAGSRHGIWVTEADFRRQLRSLRRRGFTSITFDQMGAYLRGEGRLPERPVMLTFDDGYEDNVRIACPLLQDEGMKAVIFMVAGRIGSTNTWDADEPQVPLATEVQLRELAGAGHEIGSHTLTHPNLTRIREEEARRELVDSKHRIEQATGRPVSTLAYPYGGVNESVKDWARQAGYAWGIATTSGPPILGQDVMEVQRIQVFPWTGRFGFWKKTQPWYLRYKAAKSMAERTQKDAR